MFGFGSFEALVFVAPLVIIAVGIALVLVLVWRLWRLSSDMAAIREAVEYIADCMEELWRNQNR